MAEWPTIRPCGSRSILDERIDKAPVDPITTGLLPIVILLLTVE
jgi:hypothetical protein